MIRNILVAVDGSPNSIKALDFAVDLTEKYGAALSVLNVSEVPALTAVPQEPTVYTGDGTAVIAKDLRRVHEKILSDAVAHVQNIKPEMKVSSSLREGDAAGEIVAEARDGRFDVVVVGHVGAGRVKEFFGLGGISERVAHSAPCPVIIVR